MGIIESMGKFERIADPGMNCFCYPFTQMTGRVSTRVQQLNVTTETKTKDNVSITLQVPPCSTRLPYRLDHRH